MTQVQQFTSDPIWQSVFSFPLKSLSGARIRFVLLENNVPSGEWASLIQDLLVLPDGPIEWIPLVPDGPALNVRLKFSFDDLIADPLFQSPVRDLRNMDPELATSAQYLSLPHSLRDKVLPLQQGGALVAVLRLGVVLVLVVGAFVVPGVVVFGLGFR